MLNHPSCNAQGIWVNVDSRQYIPETSCFLVIFLSYGVL